MDKNKENLYSNTYKIENIEKAYFSVIKNTKNYNLKMKLIKNKAYYIGKTYEILKNKEYIPGKKYKFYVNESGKRRMIFAQKPIDKIINKIVSLEILYKKIVPSLIDQNVASRPYLGTKVGKKYFYKYISDANYKWKNFYILKFDIHKFFESIDHNILKEKLKKKIKDEESLKIIFDIIDSDEKGLTLGSMTSQTLAIFYLNDFDHYIKEKLKIEKYIRYQDDFLIFVKTKEEAKDIFKKVEKYMEKEGLILNKSSRIYSSKENIKYLGVTKKGKQVRTKVAISKINKKIKQYHKGKIELSSLLSTLTNYYFKIGDKVFKSNISNIKREKIKG